MEPWCSFCVLFWKGMTFRWASPVYFFLVLYFAVCIAQGRFVTGKWRQFPVTVEFRAECFMKISLLDSLGTAGCSESSCQVVFYGSLVYCQVFCKTLCRKQFALNQHFIVGTHCLTFELPLLSTIVAFSLKRKLCSSATPWREFLSFSQPGAKMEVLLAGCGTTHAICKC